MTKPGAVGTYEVVVEDRHTAHALGNDGVRVLATPMLAHFCALAARRALTPGLSEGQRSRCPCARRSPISRPRRAVPVSRRPRG